MDLGDFSVPIDMRLLVFLIVPIYCRGVTVLDSTRQVYNLGNGGFPVHHDPVHGIVTNHEK